VSSIIMATRNNWLSGFISKHRLSEVSETGEGGSPMGGLLSLSNLVSLSCCVGSVIRTCFESSSNGSTSITRYATLS